MSTIPSFKRIQNKSDVYRGKNCMKKFCESLKEHAMKIINFKKVKMKFLTKEQQISVIFAKKNFKINMRKRKKYHKVRIVAIIQWKIEILLIAYVI